MSLKLTSPAFNEGETIPKQYTGEGSDLSPPLNWSKVPHGTREFAILCEDPDAPRAEPFVHWLIYDISPNVTSLPEGLPAQPQLMLPVRADQGRNDLGSIGYGGPMPPKGHGWHRYYFTLYALDRELGLPPGAGKHELLKAMDHHIIGKAVLMGRYVREAGARSKKPAA